MDTLDEQLHRFHETMNQAGLGTQPPVLGELHNFLKRFVAYPSAHAHVAHTLWIAHCHLMDDGNRRHELRFFHRNLHRARLAPLR